VTLDSSNTHVASGATRYGASPRNGPRRNWMTHAVSRDASWWMSASRDPVVVPSSSPARRGIAMPCVPKAVGERSGARRTTAGSANSRLEALTANARTPLFTASRSQTPAGDDPSFDPCELSACEGLPDHGERVSRAVGDGSPRNPSRSSVGRRAESTGRCRPKVFPDSSSVRATVPVPGAYAPRIRWADRGSNRATVRGDDGGRSGVSGTRGSAAAGVS
jgi:hypothetical protein